MGALRRHLTYANVTSTLCLFILLGGSSYAVSRIGSREIADNSVRSQDVRDDSLMSSDFKRGEPLRARIAQTGIAGGAWGLVDTDGRLSRSQHRLAGWSPR